VEAKDGAKLRALSCEEIAERADLSLVPAGLRASAIHRLADRDHGFLGYAGDEHRLRIVAHNVALLRDLGLYEASLLCALIGVRVNLSGIPPDALAMLVGWADRGALLAAGTPLPGPGPFTLYRGVGGVGRARRIRGLSWTANRDRAEWFASRASLFRLKDAAVYRAVVPRELVLAYVTAREEDEYLVLMPRGFPVERETPPNQTGRPPR